MWGVDPDLASALIADLRRWDHALADTSAETASAETVSLVASGVRADLVHASTAMAHLVGALDQALALLHAPVPLPPGVVAGMVAARQSVATAGESHRPSHRRLDEVLEAMMTAAAPGQTGLPAGLFPPTYLEWRASFAQRHPRSPVLGPTRDLIPGAGASGIPESEAIRLLHAHVGIGAAAWFGSRVAGSIERRIVDRAALGEVAADPDAALAFFNQLGASGVTQLALDLHRADADDLVAELGRALAAVSHGPGLEFGGRDLIAADLPADDLHFFAPGGAERLLAAPGFDRGFLVDALVGSVELRRPGSVSVATALRVAVDAGVAEAFVRQVLDRGLLDRLLSREGEPHEMAGDALALLLGGAALSPQLRQDLLDQVVDDRSGRLGERSAAALEALLIDELHGGLVDALPWNRRTWLEALDLVVASNGGALVLASTFDLLASATARETQVASSFDEFDLRAEGELIAEIHALVYERLLRDAAALDAFEASLSRNWSVGTGGAGAAVGVAGLVVTGSATVVTLGVAGLVFTLLGLAASFRPDDDHRADALDQLWRDLVAGDDQTNLAVLIGLVESGLVTFQGRPVGIATDLDRLRVQLRVGGDGDHEVVTVRTLVDGGLGVVEVDTDDLGGFMVQLDDGPMRLDLLLSWLNEEQTRIMRDVALALPDDD